MKPSLKKVRVRSTKEIETTEGVFASVSLAAQAHGITYNCASCRAKRGTCGWRYTGNEHRSVKSVVTKRKRFCSKKCREAWHSKRRDYSAHHAREGFANYVLRFMEKTYGPQIAKMRVAWESRKQEKML